MSRPRKYEDPAEFEAAAEAYFAKCEVLGEPPTMAGIAYTLGFADRQSFTEYEGYEEPFSLTVKRARLRIEGDRSKRLLSKENFTPGVIFDLKNNHGWKDQTQQEVTGTVSVQKIVLTGPKDGA